MDCNLLNSLGQTCFPRWFLQPWKIFILGFSFSWFGDSNYTAMWNLDMHSLSILNCIGSTTLILNVESIFLCLWFFITNLCFLLFFNLLMHYSDHTILIKKMLTYSEFVFLMAMIRFKVENIDGVRGNMTSYKSRIGFCRMHTLFSVPNWKLSIPCTSWKIFCAPENSLVVSEKIEDAGLSDPEQVPEQPLRTEEVRFSITLLQTFILENETSYKSQMIFFLFLRLGECFIS